MILSEPEEITTMSGQKLPLKCSVDYISFSAHTDCNQTTDFIRELRPPHVVRNEIINKIKKYFFFRLIFIDTCSW
jgi:Cft2 family RNA processing exonuclease